MSEPYCDWLAYVRALDIERAWCVVICASGREKAVAEELALAGWSTYLPMQRDWRGKGPRRRPTNLPLFARYLFAAVNPGGDVAATHAIDGVVTVRRRDDGGSVVRVDLLAWLMLTEANHGLDLTYAKPKPKKGAFVCGQTVTVRAGVLRGWDALILKVLSEREVIAEVTVFGAPGPVTFATANLEAA